ncbi:hypothetical protein [Ancylomarina longa]|nr:hypothetical protein [Ancylomarina longa]
MRKLKDLSLNEKLMISFVVILLIGIAIKWKEVKKGFFKGFQNYTEQVEK